MKKAIKTVSLIMLITAMLGLCACGGSIKAGDKLYQVLGSENIGKLAEKLPESLCFMDENMGCGYTYDQPEDVQALTDMFTAMEIVEKTDDYSSDEYYDLSFYWDDSNFENVYFYGDVVEVYNAKNDAYEYYRVSGAAEFIEYAKSFSDIFKAPAQYIEAFTYEGLTVENAEYIDESDGVFSIPLQMNNTSDSNFVIELSDLTVDGFPVHTYQSFGVDANGEVGYYIAIPVQPLNAFGISSIAQAEFRVNVYEGLGDYGEKGELLYTSEPVSMTLEGAADNPASAYIEDKDCIYSEDNVDLYVKQSEEELYTALNLYCTNARRGDIRIGFRKIVLNGEEMPIEGSESVYQFKVPSEGEKFAFMPLYNYVYDQAANKLSKTEIESLSVLFFVEESDMVWEKEITIL